MMSRQYYSGFAFPESSLQEAAQSSDAGFMTATQQS
jgi:hypothetical protein